MANCCQCGKSAVVFVGDYPLCIDCNLKLQQSIDLNNAQRERTINYLTDQIEAKVGLPGILPRYPDRQPVVQQGNITLNNIKVDNSIIGAINTGYIKTIDVTMSHLRTLGNEELANQISRLTEEIIKNNQINEEIKNELLEKLAFIANEISLPKEKRKKGILKTLLSSIKDTLSTYESLLDVWNKTKEILENYLF